MPPLRQVPEQAPLPENQPDRVRKLRLVNPTPSYDPPMTQGVPPGPLQLYTPPPVMAPAYPQQPAQTPYIAQEPIARAPQPQSIPQNSTPVMMGLVNPPSQIKPGDLVPFEFVLRNPASVAALDVHAEVVIKGARLESAYPAILTIKDGKMNWLFPIIAARSDQRIKVMMRASTPDCDATWSVWGPPVVEAGARLSPQPPTMPIASGPSAGLSVTITGPPSADLNQPVLFNVRIVNTGSQPIIRPVLRVTFPSGLKHPDGSDIEGPMPTLPPGSEKTIPVWTTVVQLGRQTVYCSVSADNAQKVSAQTSIMLGRPGLQVQQQPKYRLLTGQNNEVRFQVINNSDQMLRQVSVTDTLPDGIECDYVENGIHFTGSRDVNWQSFDLGPNQAKVLSLQIRPRRNGEWSHDLIARSANTAEVTSAALLQAESSSNVSVKVVGTPQMKVGGTFVYRVIVTNEGNTPASNVQVRATLTEGLANNHAQGPVGTTHRVEGQQISFTPLARLEPQSHQDFFVGVVAQSPGDRGVCVHVYSDQSPQPITRDERTIVLRD